MPPVHEKTKGENDPCSTSRILGLSSSLQNSHPNSTFTKNTLIEESLLAAQLLSNHPIEGSVRVKSPSRQFSYSKLQINQPKSSHPVDSLARVKSPCKQKSSHPVDSSDRVKSPRRQFG